MKNDRIHVFSFTCCNVFSVERERGSKGHKQTFQANLLVQIPKYTHTGRDTPFNLISPEAKGRFLVEPHKKYPQAVFDWLSFLGTYIFRNWMMPDTKVWAILFFWVFLLRVIQEGWGIPKKMQKINHETNTLYFDLEIVSWSIWWPKKNGKWGILSGGPSPLNFRFLSHQVLQ